MGVYDGYLVGLPDVGVDVALDVFEFVDLGYFCALMGYGYYVCYGVCFWVDDAECVCAVAHYEVGSVLGESPAFVWYGPCVESVEL